MSVGNLTTSKFLSISLFDELWGTESHKPQAFKPNQIIVSKRYQQPLTIQLLNSLSTMFLNQLVLTKLFYLNAIYLLVISYQWR